MLNPQCNTVQRSERQLRNEGFLGPKKSESPCRNRIVWRLPYSHFRLSLLLLATIPDPRRAEGKRERLSHVLPFSLLVEKTFAAAAAADAHPIMHPKGNQPAVRQKAKDACRRRRFSDLSAGVSRPGHHP